jgi:hypothetical protein
MYYEAKRVLSVPEDAIQEAFFVTHDTMKAKSECSLTEVKDVFKTLG